MSLKGHAVIDILSEAFFVGDDEVTAIYLGTTLVWPSFLFFDDMFWIPEEGDG